MVVGVVGGVVGGLNKVEVPSHDQVEIVGDGVQLFDLVGAAAMVVIARGQVNVQKAITEGGGSFARNSVEADALCLAAKIIVEPNGGGSIVVPDVGGDHDGSAPFTVAGVVVEDFPAQESSLELGVLSLRVELGFLDEDDVSFLG